MRFPTRVVFTDHPVPQTARSAADGRVVRGLRHLAAALPLDVAGVFREELLPTHRCLELEFDHVRGRSRHL